MPHYRAEILTIFGSYFGRNDDFKNSFWNLLTFRYLLVIDAQLSAINLKLFPDVCLWPWKWDLSIVNFGYKIHRKLLVLMATTFLSWGAARFCILGRHWVWRNLLILFEIYLVATKKFLVIFFQPSQNIWTLYNTYLNIIFGMEFQKGCFNVRSKYINSTWIHTNNQSSLIIGLTYYIII